MTSRPTPPPFPNTRPQPLVLPYAAKGTHSGTLRFGDRLALVNGGIAVVTGITNGWLWLSGLGILVIAVAAVSWWRARGNEPTTPFEVREDGLMVDGILRPFSSVVAARRTSSATSFWNRRRTSLWLEFDDGSHLGIGHWIDHFAAIQSAVIERLPDDVRARILADSKLVE